MTNKEKFINNMHKARTEHIRWVHVIKLLVSGVDIDENKIELDATRSQFGVWYYDEAMLFRLSISRLVLEKIENILMELHDEYMKIYSIYYGNKKNNRFSSFFGERTRISANEMKLSQGYYEDIVRLSDILKKELNIFEIHLKSFSDEQFDELINFTQKEESASQRVETKYTSIDNGLYRYGARGR